MSFDASALQYTAGCSRPESLGVFAKHLDPLWIDAALQATGKASLRRRRLPAEQVVWLVLGMALMRDRPIAEVVGRLDLALPGRKEALTLAPSSIAEARARLGPEPVAWLFDRCSQQWAHDAARKDHWRGLALYAVDGSTLTVADSKQNREHFGAPKGGDRGDGAYPVLRFASLMAVRSHLLAAVEPGPYSVSEHALCEQLWPKVPDDSLTLVDRNFLAAKVLLGLQNQGRNRHWMVRAKSNSKWKELDTFGHNDKLVEMQVSSEARRKNPELPAKFIARAIGYRHKRSQGQQWLLTSLVDAAAYPADEVIARYHERWEIELGYGEVKTELLDNQETIRSRTVDGVRQEFWGVLLTYNLIRLEMYRIAQEACVAPSRISFVAAMRYIRDEWAWCAVASPGSIPSKLQRMRQRILGFVLPPRRSERAYPRAVKVKMSNYARKRPDLAAKRS